MASGAGGAVWGACLPVMGPSSVCPSDVAMAHLDIWVSPRKGSGSICRECWSWTGPSSRNFLSLLLSVEFFRVQHPLGFLCWEESAVSVHSGLAGSVSKPPSEQVPGDLCESVLGCTLSVAGIGLGYPPGGCTRQTLSPSSVTMSGLPNTGVVSHETPAGDISPEAEKFP